MSTETVPKGYKRTEVGVIPDEWGVEEIDELVELTAPICYGVVQVGKNENNGVPVVAIKYVKEISYAPLHRVHERLEAPYARSRVKSRDVLISIKGTIGRVGIVPNGFLGNISRELARIRLKSEFVPEFVASLLEWNVTQARIARSIVGTTRLEFSIAALRKFQIAVPDPSEQQAIATALSDADALIESLEQLIAKKRQIKQGAMQELLTGKRRLPGFTGKWDPTTLFDLAERKKELFDDGDWIESEHITAEGIRLIQTGNIGIGRFQEKDAKKYIYEKSFESLRCKPLQEGDLLVCRLADPAGRACVLPDIGEERVVTSVDVTIFRPPIETVDRRFLSQVFSTADWFRTVSDRSGGTTHKRISRGALGRISIQLPPPPEQTAIAAVLSDMDTELESLEGKLDKARQVKQGMMQQLLTGKVRLV